jgi:hypothetical protein
LVIVQIVAAEGGRRKWHRALLIDSSLAYVSLQVDRASAPKSADRLYNLVRTAYYDDQRFFRVNGKVIQYGVHALKEMNREFYKYETISCLWLAAEYTVHASSVLRHGRDAKPSNADAAICFFRAAARTARAQARALSATLTN